MGWSAIGREKRRLLSGGYSDEICVQRLMKRLVFCIQDSCRNLLNYEYAGYDVHGRFIKKLLMCVHREQRVVVANV